MKKRRVNYRNLAILAGMMLLILLLVIFLFSMLFRGCSNKGNAEGGKTVETSQNKDSAIVTFGDKAGGTEINLDNQCGQAIVSFKVRGSDSGDFGDNLLGDSRIKNKSTAKWYAKADDASMNVEVKLANYTSFILHDIPVSKFNGLVTIKYKDGVGYLEYKPKDSENTISTYQEELKYKDQADLDSKLSDTQQNPSPAQTAPAQEEPEVIDDTAGYDETWSETGDESSAAIGTTDGDTNLNIPMDEGYPDDGTGYDDESTGEDYGY